MVYGQSAVRQEGDKKILVIDMRGAPYGADIAVYEPAMRDVVEKLREVDVDEVVLSEYYERIYDAEQTRLLREIADLITRFEVDTVWSPSHLGTTTDSRILAQRHDAVLGVLNGTAGDPFKSYLMLVREIKNAVTTLPTLGADGAEDIKTYLATLQFMRDAFEKTQLIQRMKSYLSQLGEIPSGRNAYHSFFEVAIKPSFIGSRIFFNLAENIELVDQYEVLGSEVRIYKHPDKIEYLYFINPPEYAMPPEKYFLLEKTKEVVAAHRPEHVEFMNISQARKYFQKIYVATIADLALQNNIALSVEEKDELATIVSRYTIGYGILELFLSDRKLTDVYIDSPLGQKPIYVVHSKYGQCQTNVIFTEDESKSIVSRFRALSGRPFDQAHPILDFDLQDLQTRICVIGRPLALDGTALVFRLHKETPWTLAQFVDNKMFDSFTAGMLSFFVDAQASMLIVGSRGSGKTSMLQSMMLEIPQNLRIIVQEDTQEIPVMQMKKLGFNIQRLKTRPPLGGISETEVSAEDALRTALRLGDSVLIVGEVRSSIRGCEEVVIVKNGETKRVPIASLEGEDITGVRVPTLDTDLKIRLAPLAGFVKHPARDKLLEITMGTGRKITVTHDHSLFTANKEFQITPIECGKLKVGDPIVIPASMPCGYNDVEFLDLTEILPESRLEGAEPFLRQAIAKLGWKKATELCEIKCGDVYNYFRRNQKTRITIRNFKRLMNAAGVEYSLDALKIKHGTSTPIPARIPVNEEFCRFLGYYVSEGYHTLLGKGEGGAVVITNSNEMILNDVAEISKKLFGIEPIFREVHGAGYSKQARINSAPLALLLERLGCGRTCTEKRVPPILFGLPQNKVNAFLKTLYSGDGCFTASPSNGNCVRYNSTSKKLCEDVAFLLLTQGIVARIYERVVAKPNSNNLWTVEFKEREYVERFLNEIGFVQKKPEMLVRKWAHSKANSVAFNRETLVNHLLITREYRHLRRFEKCSKNYLQKVVADEAVIASERAATFAQGEFYLDTVTGIREIILDKPEPVYDLSVDFSENFVAGFGGIIAHNTEARALYEAMRVGAVGNVVMGTIHGESAFSIWDRVVNDLGVPTTSFKATDFSIVSAPIRFKGSLKRNRRLLEVTEVKKHWEKDPDRENGFLEWERFDANKDALDFYEEEIKKASEWIERVKRNRGISYEDIWREVKARGETKQYLVDIRRKLDLPLLLEAEHSVRAHNKYCLMAEQMRDEIGAVEHQKLLADWRNWVNAELVKDVQAAAKAKQG